MMSYRKSLCFLCIFIVLGLFICPYIIFAGPPPGTIIKNTASISYKDVNNNPFPVNSADVETMVLGHPELKISKTTNRNPVGMGVPFRYTIIYENTGGMPLTEVKIIEHLSPLIRVKSLPPGCSYDDQNNIVLWNIHTLSPNEGGAIRFDVIVKTYNELSHIDPNLGRRDFLIYNTVEITSKEGITAKATISTLSKYYDIKVTKAATPDVVGPGGVITYTLHYKNAGQFDSTEVFIKDTLPDGGELVPGSVTGNGALQGRTITWDMGMLTPGAEGVLSFQVVVSIPAISSSLKNICSIESFEEGVILSNEVTTTIGQPLFSFTKSFTKQDGPGPVFVGNVITYTLRYKNEGAVNLTNLVITDEIPDHTTFVSADAGGILTGDGVKWQPGTLAPGEEKILHLTVKLGFDVRAGDVIGNQAEALVKEIPGPSRTDVTLVAERTQATVQFETSQGEITTHYMPEDRLCLQVADNDQNHDPNAIETIPIALSHQDSGDQETISLYETGLNTGEFRDCLESTTGKALVGDGIITVKEGTTVKALYTDPLDQNPFYEKEASINTVGIVFNSITGVPVPSAVVSLMDYDTNHPIDLSSCDPNGMLQQNPFITESNGLFSFLCVPAGHYYIHVDPGPDYVFPTKLSDSQMPSGFTIETGSRGGDFIFTQAQQSINFDIPVDPPSGLEITKSANKSTVSIGDMLKYTLSVQNKGDAPITAITVIDILPHGFQYIKGSTTINGVSFSDPEFNGETNLIWKIENMTLSPQSSRDISYQVVIGPDSNRGTGRNVAYTEGMRNGIEIRSKYAEHTVKVQEGIFTTKGTIIGKVFLDKNADKVQGGPCKRVIALDTAREDEEPGIPGVAIYLEDGTKVTTDKNGKFSLPGVKPGDHVLRIDETTLPQGIEPVPTSNRFMQSNTSQFADIKPGGLFKANFAVQKTDDPNSQDSQEVAQSESPVQPIKEAQGKSLKEKKEESLEDSIRGVSITADLDFLSPENGSLLSSRFTDIIVKTPSETELTLWVNDTEISPKRVGKKVMNRERRVTIYQFIGIELLQGEKNRIKAQAQEPGGMITVKKEISVVTIGRPSRIEIARQTPVSAGESSQADFRVTILDKNDYSVPTPRAVTVFTTLGKILNKDLDPMTPGIQIPCSEGVALFSIKSTEKSGDAEITVVCDNIKKTAQHFFPPYLRDLMVVGIGEITVGKGSASQNYQSVRDEEGLKDDFYLWGRGAAFVKGRVGKDILLTGMYDTAKDTEDEFFRESDKDFESEAKYLIYGDESTIEYEGYSRTRLFLRLEKNKSYLMYGDFETDLTQTKTAAYTRTLNGFSSEIDTGRLNLHAFVSYTDQTHIVEKLPGKGIARYYTLSSSPVIEGSEMIVIETRDRQRPEYVMKRERLERGPDYYIDYDLGTIIFKMPIPSHDEYFNPLYIIVSYESTGNGDKYYIYGGRVGFEITKSLALGITSVTQEQETEDYTLMGADLTLQLPLKSIVKAELAQTESMFTIDNVYSLKRDTGWSLEFKTNPLNPFTLTGYYRNIGDYFQNDSAIDAMPGMEKYGADAIIKVSDKTQLKGEFFDERDIANDMQHRFVSAGFEKRYEKTKLEMAVTHETSNDRVTSLDSLFNRYPFENSEDTPGKTATITADAERKLTDKLILKAGHIQSFKYSDFYISHAGIEYSLSSLANIYVIQEYGKYDERMDTRTVMGAESQVSKNTVAYNEYRLDNGLEGERDQHIIGLRNKFMWGEKVTGNISFENQSTLSGKEKENEPDAFAASAGFEYLPRETVKWTTRYEYRHQKSEETSNLAEIGLAYKLTSEHSILFKERFYNDDYVESGDRVVSRTLLGLAYRPVEWDVFNALAKMEFKHEKDLSLLPELRSDAVIGSVEGVYQATPKTQIIGKYAGKLARESGFSSYTDLVSGRLLFDLSDRFDLGLEYRILNSHDVHSIAQGGSAEIGCRVVKNLWFSAGYCFDRFDPDLSNDSYRGEGPYLKIRFKFDENTLKDLKSGNKGK